MDFGLGTDVFALANQRGIIVLEDEPVGENLRGAAFRKGDTWYILVNKFDHFERKCFTIAHELAEIELDGRDDLGLDERHRRANIMAAEILLPDAVFRNHVFNSPLPELKRLFPACSFEVIARRILQFRRGVLTILDNGEITLRTASENLNYPSLPSQFEMETIKECYKIRADCHKEYNNLRMESYFIDLNRMVERIILFVFPIDELY